MGRSVALGAASRGSAPNSAVYAALGVMVEVVGGVSMALALGIVGAASFGNRRFSAGRTLPRMTAWLTITGDLVER